MLAKAFWQEVEIGFVQSNLIRRLEFLYVIFISPSLIEKTLRPVWPSNHLSNERHVPSIGLEIAIGVTI